jgi:hypothetical protein
MLTRTGTPLAALAALSSLASAQTLPDLFVCDTDGDRVWFCSDLDGSFDFNGANEVVVFYDDTVGPHQFGHASGLFRGRDGALYVMDSVENIVLRLVDSNNDGDAHDAGEALVWFDGGEGGNAAGVLVTSARDLWLDPDGVLWVASMNVQSGGNDAIIRLQDVTGDGDANDAGEALEYFVIAPGSPSGASMPTALVRGPDGAIFYAENGTGLAKGCYRIEDLDHSGTIDQPNEVTPFFIPPAEAVTGLHWELTRDAHGTLYLGDIGNEKFWRFVDVNANGTIDAGEFSQYWGSNTLSQVWDMDRGPDGSMFLAEDETPDRILRLFDVDGNGRIDLPTEQWVVYDDTVAVVDIGSPRAIAVVRTEVGWTNYCSAVANWTGVSAMMGASGSRSIVANDLVVQATNLPLNAFGFFLTSRAQGFIANPGGSHGNLCVAGPIGRYVGPGQIQNSGVAGAISLAIDANALPTPNGFVPAVPGATWHFTAWYRDLVGGVPTSNFADGLSVTFE